MKRLSKYILLILSIVLVTGCVKEDDYDNTPRGNFEALWRMMDEHYCFFDYKKKEFGLDWNEVHARYANNINDNMSSTQLFEVLCNMLSELRDGHVNIGAPFDVARYWSYFEDYPQNYNDSIIGLYLGHDYHIAAGLKYTILDDYIAYVRCESFESSIGEGNLSTMLSTIAMCRGMILDMRNNGGGQLTTAHRLASRFIDNKTLIGYYSHKTGKKHNEFSSPVAEYIEPYDGLRWNKPVVVLTNRRCYSATNDFVKCMKSGANVTIMGDKTGGGSGMPFHSELPNGWSVRYSAVVFYDKDMQQIEFGIEPDIPLQLSGEDLSKNKDTYIETAREFLIKKSQE